MKRAIASILVIILTFAAAVPAFASTEGAAAVSSDTSYNNIIGGVSFIEPAGTKTQLESLMSGDAVPSGVIFGVNGHLRVTNADGRELGYTLREAAVTIDGKARPIVRAEDEYTARAVCTFFEYSGVSDFYMLSSSADILAVCREEYGVAGTVLDLTALTDSPTEEFLRELCPKVHSAGINVCLFPGDLLTAETVKYLYSRLIYTWAQTDEELTPATAAELILTGAFAVVSRDTAVLYQTATKFIPEKTLVRTPVNVGHRGNVDLAPANTVEGFLMAVNNGADAVELDVKTTSDGELAVIHDDTTAKVSTTELTVAESTMAQLKEITVDKGWEDTEFAGVKIPTLQEVYDAMPEESIMLVEIKDKNPDTVRRVAQLTKDYGIAYRVVIICFYYDQLFLSRELLPECAAAHLTEDPSSVNDTITLYRGDNISPSVSYADITDSEYMMKAAIRSLPVGLWTIYNMAELMQYINEGFFMITTDIADDFAAVPFEFASSFEGEIIPGREIAVNCKLTDNLGENHTVKRVTVSALGQDGVTVSGKKVTFEKSGSFTLLVSTEVQTTSGSYTLCDLIHVSVPSGAVTEITMEPAEVFAAVKNPAYTVIDAIEIARYTVGYETELDSDLADINRDGEVNIQDAVSIVRTLAGY